MSAQDNKIAKIKTAIEKKSPIALSPQGVTYAKKSFPNDTLPDVWLPISFKDRTKTVTVTATVEPVVDKSAAKEKNKESQKELKLQNIPLYYIAD